MGMEGERRNGEIGGEVFEMDVRSGQRNARILDKRGTTKRKVERKSRTTDEDLKKDWRKVRGVYWLEDVERK